MEDRVYAQLHQLEDAHWWFRGRRAVIRALLADLDLPPQPRILDAGCGTGRNLQEYMRLGPVEGVDPSPLAVQFCHARGLTAVREASLESLPFEDASFDLICASDVLEHIEDDAGAVQELRRVARPEAHLLMTVPAYGWLWSNHDVAHHHFRRYTSRRLLRVVEGAGWLPLRSTYFNSTLLAPIALTRFVQRLRPPPDTSDYERTPGAIAAPLELIMRGEARLVGAGLSLPAGVSIGLVSQAPG